MPTVLTIILCLTLLAFLLRRRLTPSTSSVTSRTKEKQALIQLAAIVATFVIGYSTYYGLIIFRVTQEFKIPQGLMVILYLVPYGILRVCECVNPFLYFLASTDLKEENRRLFEDLKTSCARIIGRFILMVRSTGNPAVEQSEHKPEVDL